MLRIHKANLKMAIKLADMKANQDFLVAATKNTKVFNTSGTGIFKNYRSRSMDTSTHRSAAFARAGSEEKNIMPIIKLAKTNSTFNGTNDGFINMKSYQQAFNDDNQVSYRYLQETCSSEERQKVTKE